MYTLSELQTHTQTHRHTHARTHTHTQHTHAQWVHWVRVNIPGDNLPCDGEDGGDDLKTYVGAGTIFLPFIYFLKKVVNFYFEDGSDDLKT